MSCPSTSSGLKTTSEQIVVRPCILTGVEVNSDGTNADIVTLYDTADGASGVAAGAKIIQKLKLAGPDFHIYVSLPEGGVDVLNGIYAVASGTGVEYIVHYKLA